MCQLQVVGRRLQARTTLGQQRDRVEYIRVRADLASIPVLGDTQILFGALHGGFGNGNPFLRGLNLEPGIPDLERNRRGRVRMQSGQGRGLLFECRRLVSRNAPSNSSHSATKLSDQNPS